METTTTTQTHLLGGLLPTAVGCDGSHVGLGGALATAPNSNAGCNVVGGNANGGGVCDHGAGPPNAAIPILCNAPMVMNNITSSVTTASNFPSSGFASGLAPSVTPPMFAFSVGPSSLPPTTTPTPTPAMDHRMKMAMALAEKVKERNVSHHHANPTHHSTTTTNTTKHHKPSANTLAPNPTATKSTNSDHTPDSNQAQSPPTHSSHHRHHARTSAITMSPADSNSTLSSSPDQMDGKLGSGGSNSGGEGSGNEGSGSGGSMGPTPLSPFNGNGNGAMEFAPDPAGSMITADLEGLLESNFKDCDTPPANYYSTPTGPNGLFCAYPIGHAPDPTLCPRAQLSSPPTSGVISPNPQHPNGTLLEKPTLVANGPRDALNRVGVSKTVAMSLLVAANARARRTNTSNVNAAVTMGSPMTQHHLQAPGAAPTHHSLHPHAHHANHHVAPHPTNGMGFVPSQGAPNPRLAAVALPLVPPQLNNTNVPPISVRPPPPATAPQPLGPIHPPTPAAPLADPLSDPTVLTELIRAGLLAEAPTCTHQTHWNRIRTIPQGLSIFGCGLCGTQWISHQQIGTTITTAPIHRPGPSAPTPNGINGPSLSTASLFSQSGLTEGVAGSSSLFASHTWPTNLWKTQMEQGGPFAAEVAEVALGL